MGNFGEQYFNKIWEWVTVNWCTISVQVSTEELSEALLLRNQKNPTSFYTSRLNFETLFTHAARRRMGVPTLRKL